MPEYFEEELLSKETLDKLALTPEQKVAKRFKKFEKAAYDERMSNLRHCGEADRGLFVCTRPKGHEGRHIAMCDDEIVHLW